MSIAVPERRRRVNWTPWLAGLAALVALAVLGWAAFGGRGDDDGQSRISVGARRAATVGAVEATPLPAAFDPGPAGTPGGPGSAVLDGPTLAAGSAVEGAGQPASRSRRRARPRPRIEAEPSRPSYRAIGPTADGAPPPSPPPAAQPSGA